MKLSNLNPFTSATRRGPITASFALAVMAAFLAVFASTATASAPTLNWGSEVNSGQCGEGALVLNVTHGVTGAIDSAVGGTYWADEQYGKRIQVWEVGPASYCAIVRYSGSFVTDEGTSPQNLEPISAGITGTFEGGYRAIINGSLNDTPANRTRGYIGTFDYGCDVNAGTCATPFNWVDEYFDAGWGFSYEWWGWIYHAGANGTWVNSADGNSGDITD